MTTNEDLNNVADYGTLPEGWAHAKLFHVARINMGQSPPGTTYNERGEGMPFFQGKADFGIRYPKVRVWCTKPLKIASPGDVLISVRAPVGPTNVADRMCVIGRGLAALSPLGGIPSEIMLFQLRLLEPALLLSGTGSTFTAIQRQYLEDIDVVVPPLAEQKRIVAKVEELLPQVNAVKERLNRASQIMKRFRQAVLSAACSGRLTEGWRREHPGIETARELTRRIKASTREIAGVPELPEIPEDWAWVYLPELGKMSRGKSRHRPRNAPHLFGGTYPFIQTGDIAQSGGRIAKYSQTYSEAGLAQSRLWPEGTICITIAANIANSAILTFPACFPDSVVGIIADERLCLKEYIEFFVRTVRSDLDQFAPATAQKNINIQILNDVAVALPPIEEQREIVRRVEALFDLANAIEKRIEAAKVRADKLTQSVLAKAFRGALVPTEAELARQEGRSYEPAGVLLERIKAEREEKPSNAKYSRSSTLLMKKEAC